MGQEGRGQGQGQGPRRVFALHRRACLAGRAMGFLCFCCVPHSRSVPFLVDIRNVSSLLAIRWPPIPWGPSLLTAQLRDGPSHQPEQYSPPPLHPHCPPIPTHFGASGPPTQLPFLMATEELPSWPCHLWGGGRQEAPPSRACTPRHPSFYSKALTVTWGLTLASPSLWLPKGPVSTEPQATDRGQGRGGQGVRARAPAPQSLCICNAYVGPVHRHSAELRPFLAEAQGGVPLLLTRLPVPVCSVTNPVFSPFSFSFCKGKLFQKATFSVLSTG